MELFPWRKRSTRPKDPEECTNLPVPAVWIDTLEFSDGTCISLKPDDVLVIVGPNNSGKSATLRAISAKLREEKKGSPVVRKLSFQKRGSAEDVESWLERVTRIVQGYVGDKFELFGHEISRGVVKYCWEHEKHLDDLAPFFCVFLGVCRA